MAACPLVLMACVGCAGGEVDYQSTAMRGSVTVDGEPILDGSVQVIPTQNGQGSGVSTSIVSGQFEFERAPLGTVLVIFTAQRETGRMIKSPYSDELEPETESLIPSRYSAGIPLKISEGMEDTVFSLERRERFDKRRPRRL